jgi:hypothetical protein
MVGNTTKGEPVKVHWWEPRPERTLYGAYREALPLVDVLEAAARDRAERVMLTGPAPVSSWLLEPAPGWSAVRVFTDHETPAARYRHEATGAEVELRRAAEWFGRGEFTPDEARQAWDATERVLVKSGRGGAAMFRSPGGTGVDLWLRSSGGEVPDPLPDDVQDEIRATTPQHRIELRPPVTRDMPALWVIDGRWMYAALLRELGAGPARRLTATQASEYATSEYARGRYRVRFRAPDEWRELGAPGIILARAGDRAADGWHAPLAGEAWIDAAELQLARRWDWSCEILEGLAYAPGRPLDTWGARLVRAREAATDDAYGPTVAPLVRNAVRAVLLHAIGSFHSSGRVQQATTVSPMVRPDGDGWGAPDPMPDGRAVWSRQSPAPSARALALRHPEWSAGVWGRAHARILESPTGDRGRKGGALYVDPRTLVSVYGDAIATTRLPDWAMLDDGKPGRLRVKGHLCGPVKWPTTARERDEQVRATSARTQCKKGCE